MAVKYRNIHKDWRLIGVYTSAANFVTGSNQTSAREGDAYYDSTLNAFRVYDGSNWSSLGGGSGTAGSWDNVLSVGPQVTGDYAAEIQISGATSSLLTLDANGTTNVDIFDVSSAGGSGDLINLTQAGTGKDINGTSGTWSVSKAGAAVLTSITMADSQAITLGTSSDAVLQWDSTRLALTAAADSVLRIGAAGFSYDVEFIGNTAVTNLVKWDLDGGADSVGALIFDNADLDLGDNDMIRMGDAQDVTLKWDTSNLLIEAKTQDTGEIRIGSTNAMNFAVYGATNTDIALFDISAPDLILNGWDLQLLDDDRLELGDGKDVAIVWDQTNLLIEPVTQDTGQIRIGSTNAMDLVLYDNAATGTATFDVSTSILDINGWDVRLQDDDYLLLGDSASAGGTADGTIRWDSSNSVVEIIGSCQFEGATVTFDNDVTITGTLTASGSLDPGALAFGDGESITLGDGSDSVLSATGTTTTLAIASGSALAVTGTGGNTATWGATGNNINSVFYGTINIGENATGYDVTFYSDTNGDYILWDQNADTNGVLICEDSGICLNDNTTLRFGDGASAGTGDYTISSDGTSLFIKEVSSAGKDIQIGVDNKGIDVKLFGEAASSYCIWDQDGHTNGALLFNAASIGLADGDKIFLGAPLGTGDFSISSTSAVLTVGQVVSGTGTIAMGADGKGIDQKWFAETTGDYMLWDQDGNTNLGLLIFEDSGIKLMDDSPLQIGDAADITVQWDRTQLKIDGAAADTAIHIGSSNNQDLVIYGGTSTNAVTFDTDDAALSVTLNGFDLTLQDDDILFFGDSTADASIRWDQTELQIDAGTANGTIAFGKSTATDVSFNGASAGTDMEWNASSNMLHFLDDAVLGIGGDADASADVTIAWDQTRLNVDAAAANSVIRVGNTNNMDLVIYGGTSTNAITFDTDDAALSVTFNGFDLTLQDDDILFFGDSTSDASIRWDQTELQIDAGTANGTIAFGKSTATDVSFNGASAGTDCEWNASSNMLHFLDDAVLGIGGVADASADVTLAWDQTRLNIDAAAADSEIRVGNTNNMDLVIYGGTSTNAITFDTDDTALMVSLNGFDLNLQDDDILIFGDSTSDATIRWDQTELQIDAGTANGTIAFGKSTDTDVQFNGTTASYDVEWNASSNMLHFLDNAVLGIGGSADAAADVTLSWDTTRLNIDAAAANNAIRIGNTNNLDIVIHGETATSTITFDTDDAAATVTFDAFDLKINDDDIVKFGDDSDITISWDQTRLNIDGAAADTAIRVGYSNNQDILIYGDSTNDLITFDTSAELVHFNGFDLQLKDDDILSFGDAGTSDCYITWDQTQLKIVPTGGNIFIGDATNYTTIASDGMITCPVPADFAGLILPTHATSSPSGSSTAGAVFYEQDASKLWVSAGGTNWVSTTLS